MTGHGAMTSWITSQLMFIYCLFFLHDWRHNSSSSSFDMTSQLTLGTWVCFPSYGHLWYGWSDLIETMPQSSSHLRERRNEAACTATYLRARTYGPALTGTHVRARTYRHVHDYFFFARLTSQFFFFFVWYDVTIDAGDLSMFPKLWPFMIQLVRSNWNNAPIQSSFTRAKERSCTYWHAPPGPHQYQKIIKINHLTSVQ